MQKCEEQNNKFVCMMQMQMVELCSAPYSFLLAPTSVSDLVSVEVEVSTGGLFFVSRMYRNLGNMVSSITANWQRIPRTATYIGLLR